MAAGFIDAIQNEKVRKKYIKDKNGSADGESETVSGHFGGAVTFQSFFI